TFVSRERAPGSLEGRIPAAVRDGRLEAAAGETLSTEGSHVMLCGNPDMLRDTQAALAEPGLRKHRRRAPAHITVEGFWMGVFKGTIPRTTKGGGAALQGGMCSVRAPGESGGNADRAETPARKRAAMNEPLPAGRLEIEQPPASYAGRTRYTQLEYEALLANLSIGIAF